MNIDKKSLDENLYNPDFIILEKYQSFSKELTRISLICLGILAYFLKNFIFENPKKEIYKEFFNNNSCILYISFSFLILSATFSIFHMYFSTDSFTHIISMYRKANENNEKGYFKEKSERNFDFKLSGYLLLFACIFLLIGIGLGAIFYLRLIKII